MQFYDRLQDEPHIITITYWALRENPAPRMRSNPSSYPGALIITYYIACLSCIYFIGRDPTAQSLRDIWYTQYLPLLELLLDIFICLAMLFPKYGNEWIDLYWLDFFFRIHLGAASLVILNDIKSVKQYYGRKELHYRPSTFLLRATNVLGERPELGYQFFRRWFPSSLMNGIALSKHYFTKYDLHGKKGFATKSEEYSTLIVWIQYDRNYSIPTHNFVMLHWPYDNVFHELLQHAEWSSSM